MVEIVCNNAKLPIVIIWLNALADPRDVKNARPLGGPNYVIFTQHLAKELLNNRLFGVGASTSGKSWIRHCNRNLFSASPA